MYIKQVDCESFSQDAHDLQSRVKQTIRSKVILGEFPEGSPIVEDEIIRQMVDEQILEKQEQRTPVRQAIFELLVEGMLIKRKKLGTCVRRAEPEELLEDLLHRAQIEILSVAMLSERIHDKVLGAESYLEQLRKTNEKLRSFLGQQSFSSEKLLNWINTDQLFHMQLAEFGQSKRASHKIYIHFMNVHPIVRVAAENETPRMAIYQHHKEIIESIAQNDIQEAANTMWIHLASTTWVWFGDTRQFFDFVFNKAPRLLPVVAKPEKLGARLKEVIDKLRDERKNSAYEIREEKSLD